MEVWSRALALSLGGALGVNARYWLGASVQRWLGPRFPWATFSINVTGCFAIGFLTLLLGRWSPHSHTRLLVITGFLGGYTTFSTFAQESVTLWERGEMGMALANLLASVLCGVLAVILGAGLARGLSVPSVEWTGRNLGTSPAGGASDVPSRESP